VLDPADQQSLVAVDLQQRVAELTPSPQEEVQVSGPGPDGGRALGLVPAPAETLGSEHDPPVHAGVGGLQRDGLPRALQIGTPGAKTTARGRISSSSSMPSTATSGSRPGERPTANSASPRCTAVSCNIRRDQNRTV